MVPVEGVKVWHPGARGYTEQLRHLVGGASASISVPNNVTACVIRLRCCVMLLRYVAALRCCIELLQYVATSLCPPFALPDCIPC